ncbi:MAG TPA: isochorismatase family cysteine hydrolase [Stellaceae bacterium]|nr:isochorismatase family cysteine hydrolase [Stellaceae bacterium]
MHKIDIPRFMVERVIQLRGKEHCFEDFDPARTALLVVDMQNAYMLPGVAHALCENALEVVPNINRLARAVRAAGATVVWVKAVFEEETLESWSVAYEMAGAEGTRRRRAALTRGSKGWEVWAGLEVKPEDLEVEKKRFSAFIEGASNLEAVLRARGIDTVLVAGTVTNVCCESTARDAMMRNFKAIMVTDANAAFTDEEHNAALTSFYLVFGDIMSTDELIACLARNAKRRAAAE